MNLLMVVFLNLFMNVSSIKKHHLMLVLFFEFSTVSYLDSSLPS